MNKHRQPKIARWEKDNRWHYTERYEPTLADREQFPVSFPEGDNGPFYIWAKESFDTSEQALAAMTAADSSDI